MTHAYEVCMSFGVKRNCDLTIKMLLRVDRVPILLGEMSFCLFKCPNIGKFGDYLVDNVVKIEKVRLVRTRFAPKGYVSQASGI